MKVLQFYFYGFVSGSLFSIICICLTLQTEKGIDRRNAGSFCTGMKTSKYNTSIVYTNDTAEKLYQRVKVFCWVLTSPKTLYTKAVHVRDTWGRRCNKIVFFSSTEDEVFPAVGLPVKEGRNQLFHKTSEALEYLWHHHKDDADWFLKADDDTFVIMENLRYLLMDFDPNDGLYFGHRFKISYTEQGYMSGGAGYVLSRQALKRFVAGVRQHKCPKREASEDVLLGMCLDSVGVKAMDSRDPALKQRFFPFQPKYHLIPELLASNNWFWEYSYYKPEACEHCCSNYTISFHYVSAEMMHVYYYFVYKLKLFGIDTKYDFGYPKQLGES